MFEKFSFLIFNLALGWPLFSQQAEVEGADVLERVIERKVVPATVLADAVTAVQEVGNQTLRGEFEAVVKKMYPRFRKRSAKKLGSNEEMVAQMRKVVNDFTISGITIMAFEAEPAFHGFDVPEFNEWLVLVPTVRTIRFIHPETGVRKVREVFDYQVAIRSKEEGASWSFLNGRTLKMQELRSLFPSLPADIGEWAIPPIGGRKVR